MGTRATRFLQGLCDRCGKPREQGNTSIWCRDCATKERMTHTLKILQTL